MSQDYLDKLKTKKKDGTLLQEVPLRDSELHSIVVDEPVTATGNPINLTTKSEQNAIQTVIDLDPIQDLHGYTKPWVGGAGKNILPMTLSNLKEINANGTWSGNVYNWRGVDYTVLVDSDDNVIGIKANGTASQFSGFSLCGLLNFGETSYILNGSPATGSSSTYDIGVVDNSSNVVATDYGSGASFTTSSSLTYYARIAVRQGYNIQNKIFYPMIRLSTVSDSSFEPYTNICSILPHEEIKIDGCGKNLIPDGTDTSNGYVANYILKNDNSSQANSSYNISEYFRVMGNESYMYCSYPSTSGGIIAICFYDSEKQYISGVAIDTGETLVTSPQNAVYARATFQSVSNATYKILVCKGITKPMDYSPYTKSNDFTINLGQTVYSGQLNVENGVLVVDKVNYIFTGEENWERGNNNRFFLAGSTFPDIKAAESVSTPANIHCSHYGTISFNDANSGITGIYEHTNKSIGFYNSALADKTTTEFATTIVGVQIVYELATPYTLQLTPAQLKLFKDVNNLNSSDYTTLTVTYHSNSMATLTPATDTTDGLLTAMDKHKLNTYDIADIGSDDGVTVEDNPLTITTRSDQHALSTKVSLAPIQDLHGYSKPWVGGAGKNLLKMTVQGIKAAYIPVSGTWSGNTFTSDNLKFILITDSDDNIIAIKYEITGTLSEQKYIYLDTFSGLSGNYLLSGGVSQNIYVTLMINNSWSGKYSRDPSSDTELTISSSSDTIVAAISVGANISGSGYFYPMLRLSTEPNPTFEPYTNICSISGLDEIDIFGYGKNIFDGNYVVGYLASGRTWSTSSSTTRSAIVPAYENTVYTVKKYGGNRFVVCESDSLPIHGNDYNTLYYKNDSDTEATVKTSKGTKYLLIYVDNNSIEPNMQVEESKEVTDYEPYKQSNNLSLPLPETVYGGELDLESGELRVTHNIVDLGSLTWQYNTSPVNYFGAGVTGRAYGNNIICSSYTVSDANSVSLQADKSIRGNGISNAIYVKDSSYSDATTFKTAVTGYKLVYELETSYTIHLTPEQLTLFKDINHISTNAKSISVTYREGKLAINSPATDTKDGLLTAIDKRALDRTEEIVEGNPIAFETESVQVAKSTIVDLEPIQDLHGYSKPWVGGAGKNLLPMTLSNLKALNTSGIWSNNAYAINGVTYTILTDLDNNVIGINANNTASSNADFVIYRNENGISDFVNMIINGCNNGSSSTYGIAFEAKGIRQVTSDFTITSEYQNSKSIYIRVMQGVQVTNIKFYPMIRFSTVSDATFEPYTNIASISGRSEVDILGCGKNICTGWESGAIDIMDATKNSNQTRCRCIDFIFVKASQSVTVSMNNSVSKNSQLAIQAWKDNTFGGNTRLFDSGWNDNYYTFTATVDCYITFVARYSDSGNISPDDISIQLELGSSVTTYEPYTSSTNLTIFFGQTVYGGQLDVENGVLVVNMKYELYDGSSDENWTKSANNFYIQNNSLKKLSNYLSAIKSNEFKTTVNSITSDFGITGYKDSDNQYPNQNWIYLRDIAISMDISTAADLKTWLANNNLEVCYELATPITIQLTPHQISLLKSYNTITTNGNTIHLTYQNGQYMTLESFNDYITKSVNQEVEPYGFIEHMAILDPAQRIEYIGKNKNYSPMTINLYGDHLANYNDWHDFFVLKENEPYMIKADGTVDYALDPNDYTKKFDGSASDITDTSYTGGAFSWIPKIYKYEYVEGSDRYVYFSQKKLNDNYEAIGFIDENGLKHDGVWLPMFYGTEITQDGTVKIMSLATGTPSQSRDTATQKTYIENFSSQAKFFGGPIVNVLADLLIMLGKNSDIQAVFGTGNMSGGNGAQYMKANACLNGGAFYGSSTNTALNKAFHSLVLLTQNQWQRDPYTLCYKGEYIVSPYYKYDLTGASYVNTGVFVTPPSSNNWVYPHKSVSVPHWGAIPVGPYSGSTTTGWADGQYTLATQLTDTTVRVVRRFGHCDAGRAGGVRCVNLSSAASSTPWDIGASPLLLSKEKTPN